MDRPALAMPLRRLLLGAATALAAPAGWSAPKRQPLVLGQVALSFYAVTGAVVQEVLERMGQEVVVREGPHEEMFPLLGAGDIDLMAAAWLPEGHAAYWKRYGGAAQEVGRLYEGARFFWAVPDYVPATQVASIADLAAPAVAARMSKRIQGIGAGAAITTLSQKALDTYGLDAAGYTLRPGTAAEWIAACETARAQGQWIVFPTWTPQYLNRDGRLRALRDPRGVLGGTNHAALVAPNSRLDRLAEVRAVLARIAPGLDGVTEMDYLVNVGGHALREAARIWMRQNEAVVRRWLQA